MEQFSPSFTGLSTSSRRLNIVSNLLQSLMTWIIKIAADLIHVLIDFCLRLENIVAYLQYSTCRYRFLLVKHNEMKNALFLILKDTRNQIFSNICNELIELIYGL